MELREISDRLEIQDVIVRYTRAIDTGDWDRLDTVFTPDADIDYVASGGIHDTYPAIKPWLAEMLPMFFPSRMHTLGQFEIAFPDGAAGLSGEVGEVATCTAYFHNPMTMDDGAGGTKVVELGGLYHHELVRTAEGWRSRRLVEDVAWKRGL